MQEILFLRFAPSENLGGQGIETDPDAAAENHEGGVSVISLADDNVAGIELSDGRVVQQDAA